MLKIPLSVWSPFIVFSVCVALIVAVYKYERIDTIKPLDHRLSSSVEKKTQISGSPPSRFPSYERQTVPTYQVAPTNLKSRPEGEWDGMLIDLSVAATCERTEYCGLAQVCKDGRCLPCERDSECLVNEICILDHCLKKELASCRSYRDCDGSICVLSPYSEGSRNNKDLISFCINLDSGEDSPEEPTPPEDLRAEPPLAHKLLDNIQRSMDEEP